MSGFIKIKQLNSGNEPYGNPLVTDGFGGFTYDANLNIDSLRNSIYQPWVDINRCGFLDEFQTAISFNDSTYVFTLSGLTEWSYYRAGIKYTITGNKTITLPSTTGTYYITINSTDGTLQYSTSVWTLRDATLPVSVVRLNINNTPKYHLSDERHTVLIDRRLHLYLHQTMGTKFIEGGVLTGPTLNTATDAGTTFGITQTTIADEDLYRDLSELVRPSGTTLAYNIYYRISPTEWTWSPSEVPFLYSPTYIYWDNNGSMTTGTSSSFYNTYLLYTNQNLTARYSIVHGRGQYGSLAAAQGESPITFDWSGLPIEESVIAYQFTWATSNAYNNKGKCRLEGFKMINVATITTASNSGGINHNSLSGLQGGEPNEMYHLNEELFNTVTGVTSVINSEISSRVSGDASLSTALSSEISTTNSEVTSLSTAVSTRVSVDTSLSTAISTANSTRTSADTSLTSAISTRISVDNSLSTALSTEISITNSDIVSLSTEISTTNSEVTSLSTAVSTRISVDTSLSTAISTANSTRTSADTSLSTAISTRISVDGSLSTAISTANSTRQSADTSLSTAVSARISADTSLSTALSSEISTTGGEITSLSTAISNETSVRISADNSKLSLTGGTMTGTLIGTQLNLSSKLYLSGLTNASQTSCLYYNSTSKEVTQALTSSMSVGYATTSNTSYQMYEDTTGSVIFLTSPNQSEIWLTSDIDYNVCVNFASSSDYANNAGNFNSKTPSYYNTPYSTLTSSESVTVDCSKSNNHFLSTSLTAFTLTLTNYSNGQNGTIIIDILSASTAITISNTPTAYKNGTYTGLSIGKKLIEYFVYSSYILYKISPFI